MSTENIAHEKRYLDWQAQYDAISGGKAKASAMRKGFDTRKSEK